MAKKITPKRHSESLFSLSKERFYIVKQQQRKQRWETKISSRSHFVTRWSWRILQFLSLGYFHIIYRINGWYDSRKITQQAQFTNQIVREIHWYHRLQWLLRIVFLLIMALIVIFPFYWMISMSFRTSDEILEGINGTLPLWPKSWSWGAFHFLFNNPKAQALGITVSRALGMSLLITFLSVVSQVIISLLAGYGLASFHHKGNRIIVGLILAAMILPSESLMVGQYLFITKLNLRETLPALFIPFIGNAFTIFMLMQAFKDLPSSLKDAARIDGLSRFKFFWKVAIPAITTTLITVILISTISAWNAILWPTMVVQDKKAYYTLPMILWQIMQSTGDPQGIWNYDNLLDPQNLKMAASMVAIVPMMLLFLIAKKYLIKGLAKQQTLVHN